jgi:diaminopimelate decarboxylase
MHSRYLELVKKHGSPLYVYDIKGVQKRLDLLKSVLPVNAKIHYAMKANHFDAILNVFLQANCGVDIVSSGEMDVAFHAGFRPDDIVFSGVGKSRAEIQSAIENEIYQINVESLPELERIIAIARELEVNKPVAVALRMNPDVKTETHPYIQTGFRDNKFGFDFSEIPQLLSVFKQAPEAVRLVGLTLHIGSQIRDLNPFQVAILKSLELYKEVEKAGFALERFDVGGGVGIDYQSSDISSDEKLLSEYGQLLKNILPTSIPKILLEPGRVLVARFGMLLTEVQYVKRTPFKNFVIVDTGMNHLMRPALYQAQHRIEVLGDGPMVKKMICDVVGPICESADVLGLARELPENLQSGDILSICDAGAYGSVMMNDYNLRPRAQEVLL